MQGRLGSYRIAGKQPLACSVTKHMFIILSQTQDVCESGLDNKRQEQQSWLHRNQKEMMKSDVNSSDRALVMKSVL